MEKTNLGFRLKIQKSVVLIWVLFGAFGLTHVQAKPPYDIKLEASSLRIADELLSLSSWIGTIQAKLSGDFEMNKLYIGGGSARAILDFIYFEKPIEMRDLDIFVVANRKVSVEFTQSMIDSFHVSGVAERMENQLRPRVRGNPELPLPDRYRHIAGYGFLMTKVGMPLLDISLFNNEADFRLNGVFDVDRVMIPLDKELSLVDFINKFASKLEFSQLVSESHIDDVSDGYLSWIGRRDAEVLSWVDVERDPLEMAIRIIRTYSKLESDMPQADALRISDLIVTQSNFNRSQIIRNLIKVFNDKRGAHELKSLAKLGIFNIWSKQLNDVVTELPVPELQSLLLNKSTDLGGSEALMALQRFSPMLERIPFEERVSIREDISKL